MALLVLSSATSTMDVAREMLKLEQVSVLSSGEIEPSGILALDQTEGRGQRGRQWYSRPGESLCVTYMLPLKRVELREAGHISILAGVAAVRSLTALCGGGITAVSDGRSDDTRLAGGRLGLKWPNDVMLNGKKLGGILVEVVPVTMGEMAALIGVGINIQNSRFPPELTAQCTSLVLEGLQPTPVQLLANSILDSLNYCYKRQYDHGFAVTLAEWRRYDVTQGRRYSYETSSGTGIGVAADVDSDGSLIVRAEDGSLHAIRSATSIKEIERAS